MMLRIELVRDGAGRLVGRTASDRWNLLVLGVTGLVDSRNHAAIKSLRRSLTRLGLRRDFAVAVVAGSAQPMTRREAAALGLTEVAVAA